LGFSNPSFIQNTALLKKKTITTQKYGGWKEYTKKAHLQGGRLP
jgi:hypothetical protein